MLIRYSQLFSGLKKLNGGVYDLHLEGILNFSDEDIFSEGGCM